MMRKIVYIVLFFGMVLAVVNLALTNALASDGEQLTRLLRQHAQQLQEIDLLRQQIMEAQSLETITKRAAELGLQQPREQRVIQPQFVAKGL